MKILLLPCPFCGGKAKFIMGDSWSKWYKGVTCKKCNLEIYFFKNCVNVGHGVEDGRLNISECWNRRVENDVEMVAIRTTNKQRRYGNGER
jgi:hypothetical protein